MPVFVTKIGMFLCYAPRGRKIVVFYRDRDLIHIVLLIIIKLDQGLHNRQHDRVSPYYIGVCHLTEDALMLLQELIMHPYRHNRITQ